VVLAIGAASSLGPIAIVPLVGGLAVLAISYRSGRRKTALTGVYVGPDGKPIHLPPPAAG
jgi:hypothetical protein